jgi:orotidine-5'-phosphate decarboxylase
MLIFALDVSNVDEAKRLVGTLGESVNFYKLGLELFMADGYFEFLDWLHANNKKTFVDPKFFDVPNTVASVVRRLRNRHPVFTTVHGNEEILRAACAEKNGMKVLAVTVLTSLDEHDLKDLGFQVTPKQLVLSRAKRALAVGCDGVISSGLEAEDLRDALGENFLIVVPGIRPVANVDDQKRVVDGGRVSQGRGLILSSAGPFAQAPIPRKRPRIFRSEIAKLFAAS